MKWDLNFNKGSLDLPLIRGVIFPKIRRLEWKAAEFRALRTAIKDDSSIKSSCWWIIPLVIHYFCPLVERFSLWILSHLKTFKAANVNWNGAFNFFGFKLFPKAAKLFSLPKMLWNESLLPRNPVWRCQLWDVSFPCLQVRLSVDRGLSHCCLLYIIKFNHIFWGKHLPSVTKLGFTESRAHLHCLSCWENEAHLLSFSRLK